MDGFIDPSKSNRGQQQQMAAKFRAGEGKLWIAGETICLMD
jgi:hypothetical protein